MENKKWHEGAYFLNRAPDWNGQLDLSDKETYLKSLRELFAGYTGAITDIPICVFGKGSVIPSETPHGAVINGFSIKTLIPAHSVRLRTTTKPLLNTVLMPFRCSLKKQKRTKFVRGFQ